MRVLRATMAATAIAAIACSETTVPDFDPSTAIAFGRISSASGRNIAGVRTVAAGFRDNCSDTRGNFAEGSTFTDGAGNYRAVMTNISGEVALCVGVAAVRGEGATKDSVFAKGATVTFRRLSVTSMQDSVRVDLVLP